MKIEHNSNGLYRVHIKNGVIFAHKTFTVEKGMVKEKELTEIERDFRSVYADYKNAGFWGQKLRNAVVNELKPKYNLFDIRMLLINKKKEEALLIHNKIKRLCRKVEFNPRLKYFVTFTMGTQFASEEEWKNALKNLFKNLKTRSREEGYDDFWAFAGKFEHGSKTERPHWHGMICIPESDPRGKIEKRRQYSTKRHTWEVVDTLPYFEERIGFTDVKKIYGRRDLAHRIAYIAKYVGKEAESEFYYSRGLKDNAVMKLNVDDFLYSEEYYYGNTYRLFDDVDIFSHNLRNTYLKVPKEESPMQQLSFFNTELCVT